MLSGLWSWSCWLSEELWSLKAVERRGLLFLVVEGAWDLEDVEMVGIVAVPVS